MMPTARRTTRRTLMGPDALTLSRVPLAVAIACVAFGHEPPARPVLVTLLVTAIATDVADGWWARRQGTASSHDAALDSLADAMLTAGVAVAVALTVEWSVGPWAWCAIAAISAIRLASLGVTRARFRVVSIAHTWGNKTTGLVIAAVALGALASGHLDDWCVATACGVAVLAALKELIMAATTRVYSRDRRGWWDDNHIASS